MAHTQADPELRRRFADKERELGAQAELIRRILLSGAERVDDAGAAEGASEAQH